ncbi:MULTISPECIES: hypothetical protein [Agrobacterium]|nr:MULTISPECIES: hypothetical protein [Agrobacterium]
MVSAVPAFGHCLTPNQTKQGVLLTREQPFFSVFYKPTQSGLTEQRLMVRRGSLEPISAEYLHPLLVTKRISAKGVQELTYSDATRLDDLPVKGNWRSGTTLFVNSQRTVGGTTTITFEKWAEETIGFCSYPVWVVKSRVELQGLSPIIFEQYYSPKLNLVLRSIRLDPSGHPISEVRFDWFQIGWSN